MSATTNATVARKRIRVGRAVVIFVGFPAVILFGLIYANYQGDIRQARERISVGSQIIETACGPIEYAVAGNGPPVLVAHGAGGGYDQGLDITRGLVESGFRVVAMSRFGYLRTPLPADASPAAQADAHACLLDALDIRRAAVIRGNAYHGALPTLGSGKITDPRILARAGSLPNRECFQVCQVKVRPA